MRQIRYGWHYGSPWLKPNGFLESIRVDIILWMNGPYYDHEGD